MQVLQKTINKLDINVLNVLLTSSKFILVDLVEMKMKQLIYVLRILLIKCWMMKEI